MGEFLRFYDDPPRNVERLILLGLKLITLRLGDYSHLARGTGINIVGHVEGEDEHVMSGILVSNERRALREHQPGILLLDGYLNPNQAARDLQTYYPNREVTVDTPTSAIMFLTMEAYNALGSPDKELLLAYSQADLLAKYLDRYRQLFFPAFYWWITQFHQIPAEKYPYELANRDLIPWDRVQPLQERLEAYRQSRSQEKKARLLQEFIQGKVD